MGARLVRGVAYGDYIIELAPGELIDVLCARAGNVDASLGHDLDGAGVDWLGVGPGRGHIDFAALEMPGPALGHLAAA